MPTENKNGSGAAQIEKNLDTPADSTTTADANADAEAEGGEGGSDDDEGADEEVTVKKSELNKFKKMEADNDNYQKALGIGKYKKSKKEPSASSTSASSIDTSDFVKKSDLEKGNQKKAIELVTTVAKDDDSETAEIKAEIDKNFDAIKEFYTPRRGKGSPEAVVKDLFDAHTLWKRDNKKQATDNKTAKSDLQSDRGQGGRSPSNPNAARKSIIPKNTAPKDWYKKA